MARRKRRRDVSDPTVANPPLERLPPFRPEFDRLLSHNLNLRPFEDRRTFHPARLLAAPVFLGGNPPARSIVSAASPAPRRAIQRAVGVARLLENSRFPTSRVRFAEASRVVICVRRKRRKEVLFARRKAGRRGQRRPRRNLWSDVQCR